DEDVLNLIRTMGIYPPLIALPFEFKYKLSLFANQLRAGTPDLSEMIKDGLADTRWAYLTLFGPGLLTLLLSLRKANKFEEKIAKILNAVADMLFLAADPQAAINDTVGYLLCACLTFFRRATKLLSQSSGDLPPSVNELCRTMFGLTERQLEQMIRSLGSTSHQPLNATTGRLTDDDWGYPIRMDRVFTQTVLPTSNFDRSELIYPVYCIDYDLLSLPFKKSFEPLVYVSRWVVPGGENGPTDSVSAPHQIFDSKDAVATSSQIETAITDPTLQLIQTINLASLLLECGFEAEGFTGILSRFMASSGTVGYYVREFIGKQIAYSDANAMLNGFSISTVIRFLWRQMITDEFVAFFAQNYRNAETFSDVDAKLEWLWTVIPWMSTATRRRTIQQVMGVLDFDTAPTVIRDTKLERDIVIYGYRRIDVSDRLPDGSILYRLGGKESTESGTAFTRWQDLPRIDRDAFHLFMQEMAKSDQELVALAKQWKELRANPFRPSAWRVKDFEPLDVEPEEAEYIDPDRTMSGPQTPITLEQLIAMAFSATPEWSKP
ncbi:hypothetical protein L6R49_17295, partial [Myxococcota bacterium]|nr:hypothetical protein [Myxococcota bacterium]